MRRQIIDLLRDNKGRPVSGEEISQRLDISRTAVWKHINVLKEEGYAIDALHKKGYILHSAPDLLLPAEVSARLSTKWLGREIIYLESVASTNDVAKRAALDGAPHGTLVVAEEQTGGRGRIARGWFSPFAAGIWFSLVLRPPLLPSEASKFTLLMAVAVAEAIEDYLSVRVDIKWPNDILYHAKKMVGILTEMSAETEAINYLVIGTGVNIGLKKEDLPDDLKDKAASLADFSQKEIDRVGLLAAILEKVEVLYAEAVANGFVALFDRWRKYSITLGREVRVIAPGEEFTGRAEDIDKDGALLVRRSDGMLAKVLAGDVSIRAAAGDTYI